jgi:hypothetical protein
MMVLATAACEPLDDTDPVEPPEQPDPVDPVDPVEPVDPLRKVGPITGITPRTALLGQKLTVTIMIGGDKPGPGSDVSFGPGIDVIKAVEVAGGLAVDIIVEADAASGTRDVTVAPDDAPPLSAPKGFTVASAMDVTIAAGKAEQGGLVRVGVATKDGRKLAPATFEIDALHDTGVPTLFQIARGVFTDTTGSVIMLGDPLAKLGPQSLLGTNDPTDPQSPAFFAENAITTTARAAVPLVSGVPSNMTLAAALETAFYSVDLTPQANEGLLVDGHAQLPGGSTMKPVVYGYPASGKLDDILDVKQEAAGAQPRVAYPVTAATKGFFVVFDKDFTNAATTTLTFDFRSYRATIAPEQAGAHDVAAPQNLGALPAGGDAVPGRIVTGSLDTPGEIDAYVLSGFPAGVRDIQISLVSDAEVDIIVDHVAGFNDDPTTFSNTDRAASGTTTNFQVDPNRYIQVTATNGATRKLGKYVLGIRAVN